MLTWQAKKKLFSAVVGACGECGWLAGLHVDASKVDFAVEVLF
jgi:hypothetical protein